MTAYVPCGKFARPLFVFSFYTKRISMKMKRTILIVALLAVIPALSGCWYVVAGGAGAYGGYKMKQKGYTLQNPITKEKSSQPSR